MTLLSIPKESCCHESKKFRKMQIPSVSFGLRTQNLNLEVEITFLNFRFLQRSSDLSKGEY